MTAFLALFQDWWDVLIALLLLTGPVSLALHWRLRRTNAQIRILWNAVEHERMLRASEQTVRFQFQGQLSALETRIKAVEYNQKVEVTYSGNDVAVTLPGRTPEEWGRIGGLKRAKNTTPAQRSAISKKGADARWGKSRQSKPAKKTRPKKRKAK